MTEAERLQKIVVAQEKELRRLRRLLAVVRIAQADFRVEDNALVVTITAIGVDEYHFTEQAKPELEKIAEQISGIKSQVKEIKDATTDEPAIGAVVPL